MRRVLATLSLVLAWLCANGAVWDVMQVAAWSRMFADYSQTMKFSQALQETLDPSKPCDMCLGIATAKQEADQNLPSPEQQAAAKFVLVLQAVDTPVFSNDRGEWAIDVPGSLMERTDPVPLQPPRV